jgi:molybdenum cofactor cytidylyltransferase
MKSAEKIAAIILAAGASTRLGQPKQLLKLQGQSLIRRAAVSVIDGGCDPVIVVTGAESQQIVQELNDLSTQIVFHAEWANGIGSSLRTGVGALQNFALQPNAVVIAVCDQPYMNAEVIERLIDGWRQGGKAMAACQYRGAYGTPCCFASSKFLELSQVPDDTGAKPVLSADPGNLTLVPWALGALDLDLPEDLKIANLETSIRKSL